GDVEAALWRNGVDRPISLFQCRNVGNRPIEMVRSDVNTGALQKSERPSHQVEPSRRTVHRLRQGYECALEPGIAHFGEWFGWRQSVLLLPLNRSYRFSHSRHGHLTSSAQL